VGLDGGGFIHDFAEAEEVLQQCRQDREDAAAEMGALRREVQRLHPQQRVAAETGDLYGQFVRSQERFEQAQRALDLVQDRYDRMAEQWDDISRAYGPGGPRKGDMFTSRGEGGPRRGDIFRTR
jgi:hypothetical protein